MTANGSGRIFQIGADDTLVALEETTFPAEDLLQALLADHPDLLAGDRIDPESPRRFLLIDREVTVVGENTTWYLDHLFVDQDGTPTLVEVKKGSNPELRRKVVGQMLDYSANAPLAWPAGSLRERFEARCQKVHRDPVATLREAFGGDVDPETFWTSVDDRLRRRDLRLLFVTDRMVPELRRVVEFLNEQMKTVEVLAVEIRQFVGAAGTTLVPTVFGQSFATDEKKADKAMVWTEERFFPRLEAKKGPQAVDVARSLLEWAKSRGTEVWWGKGRVDGSFTPTFLPDTHRVYPFIVWTYGNVELQFQYLIYQPPFDQPEERAHLLRRLNGILGTEIPTDAISRRPSFPLERLASPERLAAFQSEMIALVERVRQTRGDR